MHPIERTNMEDFSFTSETRLPTMEDAKILAFRAARAQQTGLFIRTCRPRYLYLACSCARKSTPRADRKINRTSRKTNCRYALSIRRHGPDSWGITAHNEHNHAPLPPHLVSHLRKHNSQELAFIHENLHAMKPMRLVAEFTARLPGSYLTTGDVSNIKQRQRRATTDNPPEIHHSHLKTRSAKKKNCLKSC